MHKIVRNARRLATLLIFFAIGASSIVAGQDAPRKVALVIAESAYTNVPRLRNPPADAALIAAALRKAGFQSVEIVRDLNKAQMEAALHSFADRAEKAEVGLVYYAGHGIELGSQNYLIPVDARLLRDRDADFEAVALSTVLRALEGARLKLVVLDACRDNPFAVNMTRSGGSGRSVSRGLARVEPGDSDMLVAYAAKAGAIAADGGGANSPFAVALARRIVEPGVEVRLLFGRVRDDVLLATNREQEPFTYGSLSGQEYFLVPGVADAGIGAREGLLWQGALSAGSMEAYRDYLTRYPSGTFATAARENIKRLSMAAVPAVSNGTLAVGNASRPMPLLRNGFAAGDNFYVYANGGWLRDHPIPAGKSGYGAFDILSETASQRTREVIEQADPESKVAAVYRSYLDQGAANAAGLSPIMPWLQQIQALSRRSDYAALAGKAASMGITGPFSLSVQQDARDLNSYALVVSQAGLGMPDKDYYLSSDQRMIGMRAAYLTHVEKLLKLAGIPNASVRAQAVVDLEKQIANVHWTRNDSRDPNKTYNKQEMTDLPSRIPGFDMGAMLRGAGIAARSVIMTQPSAISGEAQILASAELTVLSDQLIVRSLDSLSEGLSDQVSDESYDFYRAKIGGRSARPARWQRAITFTGDVLPDEVGKLYVARYFPPTAKAIAEQIGANLVAATGRRIDMATWLSPAAKATAHRKLAALRLQIGYPDRWRDISGLVVRKDDVFGNLVRSNQFKFAEIAAKLAGPYRKSEWAMAPMTVNAYANQRDLSVVFPAAMFQAPFFDKDADPASNYGAIGAVIAHELSHHFDDTGKDYDERGIRTSWWTDGDLGSYALRTARLSTQYDRYEPLPGQHLQGKLVVAESAGDLAGLTIAHDAYLLSLGGKPAPEIDGTTAEQRFYLAWAAVWRRNDLEASLKARLASSPHAPSEQRASIVRNLDGWYQAFGVQPSASLYLAPEDRVRIW